MARFTDEHAGPGWREPPTGRTDARRTGGRPTETDLATDAQGLVEFACECTEGRLRAHRACPALRLPPAARGEDQYLLQAGHHAFEHYRTIVSLGLVRIEEKAT